MQFRVVVTEYPWEQPPVVHADFVIDALTKEEAGREGWSRVGGALNVEGHWAVKVAEADELSAVEEHRTYAPSEAAAWDEPT